MPKADEFPQFLNLPLTESLFDGDALVMEECQLGRVDLKNAISQYDSVFARVYNQASGFVHLSEKAFYQTVADVSDGKIALQIGHDLPEKQNAPLLECAEAFSHFVKLHYKMLDAVVESKTRFDTEQDRDERNS